MGKNSVNKVCIYIPNCHREIKSKTMNFWCCFHFFLLYYFNWFFNANLVVGWGTENPTLLQLSCGLVWKIASFEVIASMSQDPHMLITVACFSIVTGDGPGWPSMDILLRYWQELQDVTVRSYQESHVSKKTFIVKSYSERKSERKSTKNNISADFYC